MSMVVIGIDPHKSSHTAVAVDQLGRKLAQHTTKPDPDGLLRLRIWASKIAAGTQLLWAVEDGRGVAGALVRTLIGTGARVVWVPTRLMAAARASGRERGKPDPIDALAVARAGFARRRAGRDQPGGRHHRRRPRTRHAPAAAAHRDRMPPRRGPGPPSV